MFIKFDELRGIFDEYVPRRRSTFLDIGCGTSKICRELVFHGYNRVHGIDIAPPKIQCQRDQCAELQEYARFYEMDATKIEFPDKFFDCIFSKAMLDLVASNYIYESAGDCKCNDLHQILDEIFRCLKPGATFIVVSCHDVRPQGAISDGSIGERLSTPWWQWESVSQFLRTRFDQVREYKAGAPILCDRTRVKPFVIRIYRRRESECQRLARLHWGQSGENQLDREFNVMTKWLLEKRRWKSETASNALESRRMVEEDVLSRYRASVASYEIAKAARNATRESIYRQNLEADRFIMMNEDELSADIRRRRKTNQQ
uniref:Methyltransferase type 11 domain-containing protein n=1 Tax=Globisporangium ultimum (strain ATCC 200006 / CBS 805.95 / DAOM BR144) TaxID=431595 RepID=K3W7A2_GLOUD